MFLSSLMSDLYYISWNSRSGTCIYVQNCFYFFLWSGLAARSVQNYEKWLFFYIFISFCLFPQAFGLVNECHILNLHEVIRALHLVLCWIVFLLFDDWYWQGGVPKRMKNDHCLAFLAVSVFFPKFLARPRGDLC